MPDFQEYPKWLHLGTEDAPNDVLVEDADAERAVVGEEKPKRGRPAKAE
jgi:hypothetical protein